MVSAARTGLAFSVGDVHNEIITADGAAEGLFAGVSFYFKADGAPFYLVFALQHAIAVLLREPGAHVLYVLHRGGNKHRSVIIKANVRIGFIIHRCGVDAGILHRAFSTGEGAEEKDRKYPGYGSDHQGVKKTIPSIADRDRVKAFEITSSGERSLYTQRAGQCQGRTCS